MAKSANITNPIPRKCSVKECDRLIGAHGAKGLCSAHYRQHKAAGCPEGFGHLRPVQQRALPGKRSECSVPDCRRLARLRGMCRFHNHRQVKGLPLTSPKRTPNGTAAAYIHSVAQVQPTDECIIWPFARLANGYANWMGIPASRAVCKIKYGEPPFSGAEAAHSCGKGHGGCVNPHHLRWATHSENMLDKREHGTNYCGARHHGTKLDDETVLRIFTDDRHENVIANEVGCTAYYVRQIKAGTARSLVTGVETYKKSRLRISEEMKQAICADPRSSRNIAASFGVSRTTVQNLKRANG